MRQFDEEFRPARARGESPWLRRLNNILTVVAFSAFLGVVALAFFPVWQRQQEMQRNLSALQERVARQTAELDRRTRQVQMLKADPEYLETLARDRLDMMKPGETVFRLEFARNNTPSSHVQP